MNVCNAYSFRIPREETQAKEIIIIVLRMKHVFSPYLHTKYTYFLYFILNVSKSRNANFLIILICLMSIH